MEDTNKNKMETKELIKPEEKSIHELVKKSRSLKDLEFKSHRELLEPIEVFTQEGLLIEDPEVLKILEDIPVSSIEGIERFPDAGWRFALKQRNSISFSKIIVKDLFEVGFKILLKKSTIRNFYETTETLYRDIESGEVFNYIGDSMLYHEEWGVFCYLRFDNQIILKQTLEEKLSNSDTQLIEGISIDSSFSTSWGVYECDGLFFYNTEKQEKIILENVRKKSIRQAYTKSSYENNSGTLYLVVSTVDGFGLKEYDLTPTKIDFDKHYNDDFKEYNDLIVSGLSKKNSKGIVLLHGIKGSGKTTYIKYLTTLSKYINKKFIFIPSDLAPKLSDPSFIKLVMQFPNSIFIVEDAEIILRPRSENQPNSAVSTILNLGDGLLSDCLNTQFIFTFNTELSKVDSALTREGRLIASYEFTKLSLDKSKALTGDDTLTEELTLAEALFRDSNYGKAKRTKKKKVGFGS